MIQAVILSNNSPTLLNIFLQSAKKNCEDVFSFSILYKAEDSVNLEYLDVFKTNDIFSFTREIDFKQDLINILNSSKGNLITFFKDTNYFFTKMPELNIESIMSDDDIFCFSMALGKNIKHCYHNDVYNVLLNDVENGPSTIKWNWVKHYLDFGRPLELGAGHVFHKKEIIKLLKKWNYNSIKTLEESFDNLDYYPKESMSSFKNSVMVDIISKDNNLQKKINEYDFSSIDRIIIEI